MKKLTEAQEAGLWGAFYHYKENAADQGVPWSLDFTTFHKIIVKPCTFCRTPSASPYTTTQITVKKATATEKAKRRYADCRSHLDRLNRAAAYDSKNAIASCNMCLRMRKYILPTQLERLSAIVRRLKQDIK